MFYIDDFLLLFYQVAQRCSAPLSTLLLNDARTVPVFVEFVALLIQTARALVHIFLFFSVVRFFFVVRFFSPKISTKNLTLCCVFVSVHWFDAVKRSAPLRFVARSLADRSECVTHHAVTPGLYSILFIFSIFLGFHIVSWVSILFSE